MSNAFCTVPRWISEMLHCKKLQELYLTKILSDKTRSVALKHVLWPKLITRSLFFSSPFYATLKSIPFNKSICGFFQRSFFVVICILTKNSKAKVPYIWPIFGDCLDSNYRHSLIDAKPCMRVLMNSLQDPYISDSDGCSEVLMHIRIQYTQVKYWCLYNCLIHRVVNQSTARSLNMGYFTAIYRGHRFPCII